MQIATTDAKYFFMIIYINRTFYLQQLLIWIQHFFSDIGELSLYLTQNTLKTLIYMIEDPLGPDWVQIQVGIGRLIGPFQVSLGSCPDQLLMEVTI